MALQPRAGSPECDGESFAGELSDFPAGKALRPARAARALPSAARRCLACDEKIVTPKEEPALAARLERCAAARWRRGLAQWAGEAAAPALHLVLPEKLRPLIGVAPKLRRALRDLRDRAARNDTRWRAVAIAGMLDGSGRAHVLVRHMELPATLATGAMTRRWPKARCVDSGEMGPRFFFSAADAAAVGRARRGVEPLRVVVLAQRARRPRHAASGEREPMPWLFL